MDTLFILSFVFCIVLLIISDVLLIKTVIRQQNRSGIAVMYILLIILLPYIGAFIYYTTKKFVANK